MVDVDAIQAATTGIKAAVDITVGLLKINTDAKTKAKITELYGTIVAAQQNAMSAQMAQSDSIRTIRDLEDKIIQFEKWEKEKQRYVLTNFGGGTFAYQLKSSDDETEPPHKICANCYEDRRKSILQSFNGPFHRCPRCKSEIKLGEAILGPGIVTSDFMTS